MRDDTTFRQEIDGFGSEPYLWSGGWIDGPIGFCPPCEIETPEAQRLFPIESPEVSPQTLRLYGQRYWPPEEYAPEAGAYVAEQGIELPWSDPTRIQFADAQACRIYLPAQITPAGASQELARLVIGRHQLGIIEGIGLQFTIDALEANAGEPPIASFVLDGSDPCPFPLQHPDPAAGVLTADFRLALERLAPTGRMPAFAGVLPPSALPGDLLVPTWDDMRYAWPIHWAQLSQIVCGGSSIVRIWGTFTGAENRWRVHATGRLRGYTQTTDHRGAAQRSATNRTT